MRNFDEDRNARPRRPVEDRTFVLRGETFVARDRFRPEVLALMDEEIKESTFDQTTCRCQHRLNEHPEGSCTAVGCTCEKMRPVVISAGSSLTEQLATLDRTLVSMIEPGGDAEARYRALRAADEDPLELEDIMAVIRWLTAEDTARPTGRPDDSTSGPEHAGQSSTAVSSLPVIPAE